eukprot:CAMPEP_0113298280 /NCGR_PEP_ID=MMETSP0010_2-20120614/792_1 /TAXON_ID=216773 ORGANISM="Corethron hystrix, Strain 308" /NCGR_SAMPLE_ID=MMETSP0010_2 /ASSEMBLY_ACC=CAM_ASM_000155 /LENGTH=327 /DNA_ID=CAMNT_0000151311 /DNA_START=159 /DNA_END=1142 /DNA_ORIENTATION=- /assembly_acc=CAM_ASM_000155
MNHSFPNKSSPTRLQSLSSGNGNGKDLTRIAFLGNSILYYNDCPRLIANMIANSEMHITAVQNSCLLGGSNLASLWEKGNGMYTKFRTEPALLPSDDPTAEPKYDVGAATVRELLERQRWDFVVMNDFTQGPARKDTRCKGESALVEHYAPLIADSGAVPIFVQTWAYRLPNMRNTEDLGDFENFTARVRDGYRCYVSILEKELPVDRSRPQIAPVGDVFLYLFKTDQTLWEKLYYRDNFHPSPHGTFLEACVLYHTMFKRMPPMVLKDTWWLDARVMQPAGEDPMPLPTEEEIVAIWEAVRHVCEGNMDANGFSSNVCKRDCNDAS